MDFASLIFPSSPQSQQTLLLQLQIADSTTLKLHHFTYHIPIDPHSNHLRIDHTLNFLSQNLYSLNQGHLFIIDYSNQTKIFLGSYPFTSQISINQDIISKGILRLQYKPLAKNLSLEVESPNNRKKMPLKKIKQRTIKQAYQAVQKWRKIYEEVDSKGKRVYTLQEAAGRVGVAKKTLDDYFNHLKIAREYNFDTNKFKLQKFGLLRRFARVLKQEGEFILRQKFYSYMIDLNLGHYWEDSQ